MVSETLLSPARQACPTVEVEVGVEEVGLVHAACFEGERVQVCGRQEVFPAFGGFDRDVGICADALAAVDAEVSASKTSYDAEAKEVEKQS